MGGIELSGAKPAPPAPIGREGRVLLIVNSLAEHGDSRFRKLYAFLEHAGVDVAGRLLGRQYRSICVLKGRTATAAAFLSRLERLTGDCRHEAVDLFLQMHGRPGLLRFFDRWVSTDALGVNIWSSVKSDRLRVLYSLCCYGDSHSADFLKAGFRVSAGSLKVNANAATEYPAFCRAWAGPIHGGKNSKSFGEAIRRADRELPRRIQDRAAGRFFRNVDSRKVTRGDCAVTIDGK